MRILFLCEGTTVPATRFRVEQFLPHFGRLGIDATVRYAYGDRYNAVSRTRIGPLYKLLCRTKRVPFAADADEFDRVFIQRPAIPQSALPEKLVHWLNPNTIFDFDDSLWIGADGAESPARRRAFDEIIATVGQVIAGNAYLASQAHRETTIIPTVIDTHRYVPPASRGGDVTIGWMGTAGNFPFLKELVPSLRRVLAKNPDVDLRLVSNRSFEPLAGHPQVEQIAWSAAAEIGQLQSFDIGLMPLVDTSQTRGKCAFKMITYMSVGTPVVVSSVGANLEVFEDSNAGFCVEGFDWDRALQTLIDDKKLRLDCGASGREHVVQNYSIDAVLPRYMEIFDTSR